MCGIYGFSRNGTSVEDAHNILEKMSELLSYRGPDNDGAYLDDRFALGHRRLSIIDLSPGGHQPMSTPDKKVWITFNGEIDNFPELRKNFDKNGFRFRSQSDRLTHLKTTC